GFALNDLERVEELMRAIGDEVAAIVVAPVQDVVADTSFLRALRELADRHGSWLVFDEVVTGFRMARGGMQELTGVPADVVCLGKALGNGFPIAAVAGPRRSMRHLRTFRYGMTAQRDALSLAAANACLQVYEREDVPAHLARIGARLRERFVAAVDEHGVDWQLTGAPQWPHLKVGPHGGLTADAVLALVFETAQRRGIYLSSPRIWSCYAHREADADALADALAAAMALTREAGERGLPDFVERPVYQRLDRNHERAREERTWRDEPIASPFSTLAGTVTLSGAVRGHEANAALHEGGVRLSLGSCQGDRRPNGTATCAVFGNRPVAGDCRVLASYEIRVAELRNATVECVLAINDVEGGGHRSVSNAWSLVLGAWLHVAAKARRHRTPSYQHPEGATLVMERRSGAWHAELRSGTMTLRLPVPGG
ncbi:MAG: aminotransferase class III-fold pyridoxal phosphate-dependent enzyme, partial [Planctomycetes bacterium]|nr:aminotransferase class III-fold pyridoxal phosphate-dependent enzyme [Planctomycetota bacterium]